MVGTSLTVIHDVWSAPKPDRRHRRTGRQPSRHGEGLGVPVWNELIKVGDGLVRMFDHGLVGSIPSAFNYNVEASKGSRAVRYTSARQNVISLSLIYGSIPCFSQPAIISSVVYPGSASEPWVSVSASRQYDTIPSVQPRPKPASPRTGPLQDHQLIRGLSH